MRLSMALAEVRVMSDLLDALNRYYVSEFGEDSVIDKIPDDGIIHLAYTTYAFKEDEEKELQVDFDLINLKYLNYLDGELVLEEKRENMQDFIEEINCCSFDDIIRECVHKGFELYGE